MPIVRCRYPFPDQHPPVEMPESCSEKCPNYDAAAFAIHADVEDDPELERAIRSFAAWFYVAGQDESILEEHIRYAVQLYTRPDHPGTCIPKTVLFAQYKWQQLSSGGPALRLSEEAMAATRGERVAPWPDGEPAEGTTWNEMFARYSSRYYEP